MFQATRPALLGGDSVRQSGLRRDAICITPPQLWQFLGGSGDMGRTALIFGFDTIDRFAIPRSGTAFNLGWLGARDGRPTIPVHIKHLRYVGNYRLYADDVNVAETEIEPGGEHR